MRPSPPEHLCFYDGRAHLFTTAVCGPPTLVDQLTVVSCQPTSGGSKSSASSLFFVSMEHRLAGVCLAKRSDRVPCQSYPSARSVTFEACALDAQAPVPVLLPPPPSPPSSTALHRPFALVPRLLVQWYSLGDRILEMETECSAHLDDQEV